MKPNATRKVKKMKALKAWIVIDPHDKPDLSNLRMTRLGARTRLKSGIRCNVYCDQARIARVEIREIKS
jgi:hypothetical protein